MDPRIENITDPPSSPSICDDRHSSTTIVRGTMHQGDWAFSEESRGRQCTAVAMASIALNYVDDPRYWSHEDVDYILMMGDSLYQASMRARQAIPNEPLPQYLRAEGVLSDFSIGDSTASTRINDERYGDLLLRVDNFPNLRDIPQLIIDSGSKGILTACEILSR
ncbi:hypothetical protein QAD02_003657 [Eretmocerus hayati]|uniref:Uncharacterized protein n=1 Tax=Eretmocerus hayati TaxID=131215 RepID=A0ACC2NMG0_9HYME|nr:hypothetical protein QAD02_003657 [Eretmocerus hayati]